MSRARLSVVGIRPEWSGLTPHASPSNGEVAFLPTTSNRHRQRANPTGGRARLVHEFDGLLRIDGRRCRQGLPDAERLRHELLWKTQKPSPGTVLQ